MVNRMPAFLSAFLRALLPAGNASRLSALVIGWLADFCFFIIQSSVVAAQSEPKKALPLSNAFRCFTLDNFSLHSVGTTFTGFAFVF